MVEKVEVATGVYVLNEKSELLIVTGPKFPDWVIPGGHVEPGEKMIDCGRRELKEETGIESDDLRFLSVNENTVRKILGKERHFIYINLCCRVDNPKIVLNEELSEFSWVPVMEAARDERINSGIREQVLPALVDFVYKKLV